MFVVFTASEFISNSTIFQVTLIKEDHPLTIPNKFGFKED
jgi:hypothetical protein